MKLLHSWQLKLLYIYPIICLKSVCLATFAECSSPFLLDRLGRCLKLIASNRGTFCHEFASQFGLEFFYTPKNPEPVARSPTGPVACFSATDRQNGAIWKAVYTFTPGGDLRHNSHKMSAWAMDGFVGAPAKPPQVKWKLSALQRSSQARQRMRSIREEATVPTPPSPRPSLGPGYPRGTPF